MVTPGDVDGAASARFASCSTDEGALAAARAGAERRVRSSPGTALAQRTARSTRSSYEIPPQRRFHELVDRQLDLFAADDAELLAEAAQAESAWNSSSAESAEEAYGDYQLVVDAIADSLLDIRETYAHSLDEDAADEYRDAFTREAAGASGATRPCSPISTSRRPPVTGAATDGARVPQSGWLDGSARTARSALRARDLAEPGVRKRASLRCVDASVARPCPGASGRARSARNRRPARARAPCGTRARRSASR